MPNWCSNTVTIFSDYKEDLEDFIKNITDNPIVTDNSVDNNPDHFSMLETYLPIGEWDYDKAISTWGCKWSEVDLAISDISNYFESSELAAFSVDITFDTPWADPSEGIKSISKKFPSLIFGNTYYEQGMDFCGFYVINNGDIIDFAVLTCPETDGEEEYEFYDNLEIMCNHSILEFYLTKIKNNINSSMNTIDTSYCGTSFLMLKNTLSFVESKILELNIISLSSWDFLNKEMEKKGD